MGKVKDALTDPQRRKQCFWKWIELLVAIAPLYLFGFLPVCLAYGAPLHLVVFGTLCTLVFGPLASFLFYEKFLERRKLAGPYWERTPAEGTTYKNW